MKFYLLIPGFCGGNSSIKFPRFIGVDRSVARGNVNKHGFFIHVSSRKLKLQLPNTNNKNHMQKQPM